MLRAVRLDETKKGDCCIILRLKLEKEGMGEVPAVAAELGPRYLGRQVWWLASLVGQVCARCWRSSPNCGGKRWRFSVALDLAPHLDTTTLNSRVDETGREWLSYHRCTPWVTNAIDQRSIELQPLRPHWSLARMLLDLFCNWSARNFVSAHKSLVILRPEAGSCAILGAHAARTACTSRAIAHATTIESIDGRLMRTGCVAIVVDRGPNRRKVSRLWRHPAVRRRDPRPQHQAASRC